VYLEKGIAFDWTVLLVGIALLVLVLVTIAIVQSLLGAPHREGRQRLAVPRPLRTVRAFQSAGMSAPAVVGTHFALESGRGRTSVPVRSVLVGTVLAVAMVVATLTFASGLSTLVSHPALYGWNWNYADEQSPAIDADLASPRPGRGGVG
jgi:hypothetical protein